MEQQFRDELRFATSARHRAMLCVTTVLDIAAHAPAQLAREVWQDLCHTFRVYRDRCATGALAVAALAVAIGASTGIFGVVNAVMIRSLPFSSPESLVELSRSPTGALRGRAAFLDWQRKSPYLRGAATFSSKEMNLDRAHGALRIKVAETSANLFDLLGTKSIWGRNFSAKEDLSGNSGVAIIGYDLWQQAFGGDPGLIGRKVRVNGTPIEVIGVAPPRFDYPGGTALWIPSVFDFERIPKRGAIFFQTVGRLSVSLPVAQEMFEAEVAMGDSGSLGKNDHTRPRLTPLRERLAGQIGDAIWALTGLVTFVLLAACANVAQLLLSRGSERRAEFAMRSALGASRARLVQQLITESMALTLVATVIGIFIAHGVCRIAALVAPWQLATQEYNVLDWRVISFATILAILIGLIFGILPILTPWHRTEPTSRSHTSTGDRETMRIRSGLVAIQAAITLTLLAGSLAMGRSFLLLLETDLGFIPANAVTLNLSLQGTSHDHSGRQRSFYEEALKRLRAAEGVQSAGAVSYLPLGSQAFLAGSFRLDSGQQLNGIVANSASPDYFRAIGTPFVTGRDFRAGERGPQVIVNEAFAELTGLGKYAVGRRLTGSWTSEPYEIVGIVQTTRFSGPSYPGVPMIYWRIDEEPPAALTLVARVTRDAKSALAVCRDAVRALDPAVPLYDVKTFEQRLADTLAKPRFFTQSAFFLGGLAALVVVAGIYGSAARSVAQRKRELGVRLAIGATRWQVRALIVRELILPVTVGVGAGIAGALVTGRYVEHLIANAEPVALRTCMAAAALLVVITSAAAWIATSRILSINPAECVRSE